MHLAHFVGDSGVEKHTLSSGRFARIHMGDDAYIAVAMYRRGAGHRKYCCVE
jgi:hypothetical protein